MMMQYVDEEAEKIRADIECARDVTEQAPKSALSARNAIWAVLAGVSTIAFSAWDFAGDIFSAQAFSHSGIRSVELIGYAAAFLLFVSCAVAFCMVSRIRARHPDVHAWLARTSPLVLDEALFLLSCTHIEVLSEQVALLRSCYGCPAELSIKVSLAELDIKKESRWTQVTESFPQFSLQVAGTVLLLRSGGPVSIVTFASILTSMFFLFVKGVTTGILFLLDVNVSATTLRFHAGKHQLRIEVPEPKLCVDWFSELGLVLLNIFLIVELYRTKCFLMMSTGCAAMLLSYLTACSVALRYAFLHRDVVWHCLLNNGLTFIILAASIHPCALAAVGSGHYAPHSQPSLLLGPLIRSVCFGSLSLYAVWLSKFPVSENELLVVAVLNSFRVLNLLSAVALPAKGHTLIQSDDVSSVQDLVDWERQCPSALAGEIERDPKAALSWLAELISLQQQSTCWLRAGKSGGIDLHGRFYDIRPCFIIAVELDNGNAEAWHALGEIGGGWVGGQLFDASACSERFSKP